MEILDRLPLWLIFVGTVALALMATELGYLLGLWLRKRGLIQGEAGPLVAAIMGLTTFLLALMLANVAGHHNERWSMVVTESNAIGTAYLRAGFLDEPDRTLSRDLLREYVEVRLAPATDPSLVESALMRSEEIHSQLWSIVEDSARQGNETAIMAIYAESINEVIDVHALRVKAAGRRLPRILSLLLYVALVFSFLVLGISSSREDKRVSPLAILLFASVLSAILAIIVDLDQPQQGLANVSQSAMSDLLRLMTP